MPRYDLPKAAEGPLRLVQLFVNTVDHERAAEWLPTPAALGDWLAEHGLAVAEELDAAGLERAQALREALRTLLRANALGGEAPDAVRTVNEAAAAAGLRVQLDETAAPRLVVHGAGVDAALGRILVAVVEAMLDGSWSRLKACRQCGWAFYDASRNRSATWCSMQICGNRTKTRAYRRRRAARSGR
ncbi:MAG TPA: ABATE domain-containing protein [Gaiellaceae bacterium]|nr:ABATE domain-containing protein [Gaiellaceae bacterium]